VTTCGQGLNLVVKCRGTAQKVILFSGGVTNMYCIKLVSLCLANTLGIMAVSQRAPTILAQVWEAYSYFLQRLQYRRIIYIAI
jgi:hypothetical protein